MTNNNLPKSEIFSHLRKGGRVKKNEMLTNVFLAHEIILNWPIVVPMRYVIKSQ